MARLYKAVLFAVPMLLIGSGQMRGQASIITSGVFGQGGGLCLEVSQGQSVANTWIRTHACNGSDYQKFYLSGGQLHAQGGRCIGIWGSGNNWDHIVAAPCNSNRDQQWRVEGKQIKSNLTNRCWDLKNGWLGDNGEIQLWDCHWGYNQEFAAFSTNRVATYAPINWGPRTNIWQSVLNAITNSAPFTMPIGNNLTGAVFQLNGSAPLNGASALVAGR